MVVAACPTITRVGEEWQPGYFQADLKSGTAQCSSVKLLAPAPKLPPLLTGLSLVLWRRRCRCARCSGGSRPPGSVGVIVLAAGAGERLGGGKQLLAIAGEPKVPAGGADDPGRPAGQCGGRAGA